MTSYEDLSLDKGAEEKIKSECFPEFFLKEFSTGDKDVQEELKVVDEVKDDAEDFSVLAARAGRGVAQLLVYSV